MTVESPSATLTLSLVSHTNVGKTTLARTLLQRDVGEVLDQAHVTDVNEAHVMVENEAGESLVLWDTPGFGDTVRLLGRLKRSKNPIGWFLSQVWDRFADRPLWCSQQALSNVQRDADVVLYLVSTAEDPEGAGYVEMEMRILDWIERPVIVVLNQTGPPRPMEDEKKEVERWREHLSQHPVVCDVIQLDAYTRCWVQEGLLLDRIRAVLEPDEQALLDRLKSPWSSRQLGVFREAMGSLAGHLKTVACDREALPDDGMLKKLNRHAAMDRMAQHLKSETRLMMEHLIGIHGLEGASISEFRTELEDFRLPDEPVDQVRAGLLGGVVGGAVTGLAADVMTGGLTLGGGMLAGSILGALGSVGLARGFRVLRGEQSAEITWSPEFMGRLTSEDLLRYLAVAHYGRGRGEYREAERPEFWTEKVEAAVSRRAEELTAIWKECETRREAELDAVEARLADLLAGTVEGVLMDIYPDVKPFAGAGPS